MAVFLSFVASDNVDYSIGCFSVIKLFFMNLPFRAEAAASLHKEKEIRLRSCFNEIAVRSIEMRSIYGISTAFSDATRSDFSQIVDM